MTDKHSYTFFGTDSGIILQSSLKEQDYVLLTCLKKKPDGSWEKLKKTGKKNHQMWIRRDGNDFTSVKQPKSFLVKGKIFWI